jgi:hypothetical protein
MAQEASSGHRVLREADDKDHPEHLYAETALNEYVLDATGATFTMAGSAVAQDIDTTAASGGAIILGKTAGCTQGAITTCETTITKAGVYELFFNAVVTGEADEDVTITALKNGSAFSSPAAAAHLVVMGTDADDLVRSVNFRRHVDLLVGDVVKFQILGANSEVIVLRYGSFGLKLAKSANYLE